MSNSTVDNSGQIGAIGANADVHDNTFNQIQSGQSLNLPELAKQLAELRQAIKEKKDTSFQADIAIGKIAGAQLAIEEKNSSKLTKHLKEMGKWTLEFAKEIGKDAVVEAIKTSIGMK